MKLTYIGGPTVLLEGSGIRILTDPTFDEPREYQLPGRTLKKTAGPRTAAQQLMPIDIVLLSHEQHFDNLDHAGRRLLSEVPNVFTTRQSAENVQSGATGLDPFEERALSIRGHQVAIRATPARHGPEGCETIVGDVVGFLVQIDNGPVIYISGDTVLYPDLERVAAYAPTIGVLHIGRASSRGMVLTMTAEEAGRLASTLGLKTVVPVHFEDWAHFSEPAAEARLGLSAHDTSFTVAWPAAGKALDLITGTLIQDS